MYTRPVTNVRLLDIRVYDPAFGREQTFVRQLGAAFREIGFVALRGHGIAPSVIASAYDAARTFFALSVAEKRRYHIEGGGGARGYTGFRVERAKDQVDPDLKEFWHVGRELGLSPPHPLANLWPVEVPNFKPALLALYRALDELGARVLSATALHLDLPATFFDDKIERGNSILRPLHYPSVSGHERGVRSAAHEDINLITLLVGAGEPGLEVLTRDGRWLPLATPPDQIVVNVGDMLQRLTNHALPSTTHRVVNPEQPWSSRSRYSMPFFLHPNSEFSIATLPSCVDREHPDRYPVPITADDYLQERLREIGLK